MKKSVLRTMGHRSWVSLSLIVFSVSCAKAQSIGDAIQTYPTVQVKDAPLEYRQFEKVEITGSSIVRKEQTQALPVQVITRAEIQNSGKQDVAELIQALPLMSSFTSAIDVGMSNGGASGAAIHGMQSGTVILINGRRIAPFGRQYITGVNNSGSELNLLPLSAIERIEILTDGASTIYGSDALAGVVNIITRSERPGVEITAEQRIPRGGKAQGSRVDISAGGGRLLRDGYSWFIAADLERQDPLMGADRPYAAQGGYKVQQDGKNYIAYDPQLIYGRTSPTLTSSLKAPFEKIWSADYQNGTCANLGVPIYGQNACRLNPIVQTDLYPKVEAARLHAQGQLVIDADHLAFAEFGLQQNKQIRRTRPWGTYNAKIANTPGAPAYDLAVANGLDPAKGVWLQYSGADLGMLAREFDMQTLRMTVGFKGQWRDWDYRSALYHSTSSVQYGSGRFNAYPNLGVDSQGYLSNPALLAPLNSNTPASQALKAQLQGMPYWNDTDSGTTSLTGLEMHGSRALGEIDGRDVLLAIGTDIRQEHDRFITFMPALTQPPFDGQRKVFAQFAELQLPVLPDVETIASLRHDHYSDFGNTTHAKLSAKWTPTEQWLLRGAVGTGFRAPAIAQMQSTGVINTGYFTTSPCTAALQAVADRLGGICPKDNNYYVMSQGRPDLKPELSNHVNVGLRFSPTRNHSFWLDYWSIDSKDKLNQLTQSTILGNPLNYASNFALNANKELLIHSNMLNTGQTQKNGIDFGWALREPTGWGQVQARISGTWTLKSRYRDLATGPDWVNDLNTLSTFTGYVTPKLRMQTSVGITRQNWQAIATVNYMHSYDDGGFSGINADTGESVKVDHHKVPSFTTLDLSLRYDVSKKWKVRAGIDNVFDTKSPVTFGVSSLWNYGTNPQYANLYGRTINVGTSYQF